MDHTPFCPICYVHYNQVENAPRIMPACGHTICSDCLRSLLRQPKTRKCPLDNLQFNDIQVKLGDFPLNFALNDLMEASDSTNTCLVHRRNCRFICVTDKTKICDDCIIFGNHKNHELKAMHEIKAQKFKEQRILEETLEELKSHRTNLISTLDKKKLHVTRTIKIRFEELRSSLFKREFELLGELNSFFEAAKKRLNVASIGDAEAGKEIIKKINDRKDFLSHDNFFEIVDDIILPSPPQKVSDHFENCNKEITANFDQLYDSLIKMLEKNQSLDAEYSLDKLLEGGIPLCACKQLPYDFCKESFAVISNDKIEKQVKDFVDVKTFLDFELNDDCLKIAVSKETVESRLMFVINDLKNVKAVEYNLDVYSIKEQDRELLHHIWQALGEVKTLRVFFHSKKRTHKNITDLFPALFPSVGGIQQLMINLTECKFDDTDAKYLFKQVLERMFNLKSLELVFNLTDITDRSLLMLSRDVLPLMKDLETFKLDLYKVKSISDVGIMALFEYMERIKELRLYLQRTSVTDLGLRRIGSFVSKMNDLRKLEVYLGGLEITDQGLLDIILNLNNIEELHFHAPSTNASDVSIQTLMQVVPYSKLRKLQFGLKSTYVDPETLQQLQVIANSLV